MVFKGAFTVEAVLVEGVAVVEHAGVVPCGLASLSVTGSSVARYSFCQTEKVGLNSLLPSYVCIWSWKGLSRLPLELSGGLFATFSRKQTISMSHSDAKTIGLQKSDTPLEVCYRCLDVLLDRLLCFCCTYEKDQLPLEALATWEPDRNCNECRYLFRWADDLKIPLRPPFHTREDSDSINKEDPPS